MGEACSFCRIMWQPSTCQGLLANKYKIQNTMLQQNTMISILLPNNLIPNASHRKQTQNTMLQLNTMISSPWPDNLIVAACHRLQIQNTMGQLKP